MPWAEDMAFKEDIRARAALRWMEETGARHHCWPAAPTTTVEIATPSPSCSPASARGAHRGFHRAHGHARASHSPGLTSGCTTRLYAAAKVYAARRPGPHLSSTVSALAWTRPDHRPGAGDSGERRQDPPCQIDGVSSTRAPRAFACAACNTSKIRRATEAEEKRQHGLPHGGVRPGVSTERRAGTRCASMRRQDRMDRKTGEHEAKAARHRSPTAASSSAGYVYRVRSPFSSPRR